MFIDENHPWLGMLRDQSEGPENISKLRAAIFDSFGKIFGGRQSASKAIKVDERPRLVVLRVDLSYLQKRGVRLGIEGGMPRCFRIHGPKSAAVKIPISNFEADAVIGNQCIEFKFRLLPALAIPGQAATAYTPTVHAVERVLKLTELPIRRIFITRGLNALADLSEKSPEKAIEAATSATSDCGVLAQALVDPDTVTNLVTTNDPLATAKLRGLEARENLLRAEGGTLTADQVSKILSISRQAVDKRRRAGQLIGLTRGKRGYAYPAWQFRDGQTLPGLERALKVLNRHDPWTQTLFMLNPHTDLGGNTPLAELRAGHVDAVVRAAAQYGEHGAA